MRHEKIRALTFYTLLFSFLAFFLAPEARAAGVSLVATPTTQTVTVGQTAAYTIKINRDNYADKVTLSATALPSGVTATFNPNATTLASSTLKLQTSASTPIGTFNINVKATANGITIAPIVVQLTTRPAPSISLVVNPPKQSIVAGQSTFYDIAISRLNYDGKITLSAENVPNGVTVFFEPESTYGNSSRMYLYSNNLPFLSQSFRMYVRARNFYDGIDQLQAVELHANFGIAWAAQFGAPTNQSFNPDFATDVTYDSAGNVYLTGYTFNINGNDFDGWVAKYDWTGNQLWLRMIQNLTEDRPTEVFVDAAGNVYAAGSVRAPNLDIFVAKFDPNGVLLSPVAIFGTASEEGQSGMQFGVDAAGNATLTAVTRVRRSNGPRDAYNQPTRIVFYDVTRFVFDANFNRSSSTLVVDAFGDSKDLTVAADNSIYVLSEDSSQIIGLFVKTISQIEKFNSPNGANYPRQQIGLNDPDDWFASRLKVDANGNVFAVGTRFGRPKDGSFVYSYIWTTKLNALGAAAWRRTLFGGQNLTAVNSIDIDAGGNFYVAGQTWGSLRGSNPESGAPDDPSARTDAWFGRYSSVDGGQLFLSQFNVTDHDGFNAIKVGDGSILYFAGYTLNFKNTNYGYQDALAIRCSTLFCGFVQ